MKSLFANIAVVACTLMAVSDITHATDQEEVSQEFGEADFIQVEDSDQDDERIDLEQTYKIAGSKALEIWNSPFGQKIIATFLRDIHEILKDPVASGVLVSLGRQVKNTLKNPRGSQSIKEILDGMIQIGTNENFNNNLYTVLTNAKTILSNPNTREVAREGLDFLDLLIHQEQVPELIDAVGDGFESLMHYPDPQNTILGGFRNINTIMTVGNSGALIPTFIKNDGTIIKSDGNFINNAGIPMASAPVKTMGWI